METSLARFIFVALCLVGPVFAAINLEQFRAIPKSDTSEGNKFCFAFIESRGSGTEMSSRTKNLGIYIATQESEPVQYLIRSGVGAVNRTGTVQPGQINRELYQHITGDDETDLTLTPPLIANMIPLAQTDVQARSVNDFTGIIVETVNSSQKISVMGFSDGEGSSDGFAAVPIFNVSSIVQNYRYSIFTGGRGQGSSAQAMGAIVACDRIQAGGVTIQYAQAGLSISPDGYFRRITSGTAPNPSLIAFEQYYTPTIARDVESIGGTTVASTQPIGFMTGHECGEVPTGEINCDHYVEQVPPSYTWGYNFLVAPFHSRDYGYIIKILPSRNSNTDFKVFCVNASNGVVIENVTVQNYVIIERLMANRGVFDITEQSYCSIQSNKPIAVMQYAKGHLVDDPNSRSTSRKRVQDLADPAMVWVSSASQYLNKYLTSNDIDIISTTDTFSSNGIYVTVLPHCFNASAILDNDTPIESNASKWGIFYCDDLNDICGYSASVDIAQGTHLLRHTDPSCAFNAIMYGWGNQKGYAYAAGFGMRPVAETIYNIEPLIPSAREDMGPVSVTVYKSGDVSVASSVQITTIMSSQANAATIGTDLQAQTSTVNFAPGQASAVVNFTFTNDNDPELFETFLVGFVQGQSINIGMPSQAELGIIDDDSITVMFDPVTYSVTEGDSDVLLNISFVTSQRLLGDSVVRISSIATAGATNQATAGTDYVAFSETITLPAGSTRHYYTTTIRSNPEAELSEQFSATLDFVSGNQLTVSGPDATVTIIDDDVPTIRFDPVTYTAVEGSNNVIVTISGVTSQPLLEQSTIRLTDVPTPGATNDATRNVDYVGFSDDLVLPAGSTGFSYNITILSDSSVESDERFNVDMSYVSGSSLTVTGSDATVTITDSSVVTLMFSAPNYMVPENNGNVTLTITASSPVLSDTVISLAGLETNGGASSRTDFSSVPAAVTIPSGQSSISFSIGIIDDAFPEPTESFDVRMTISSGQSVIVPSGADTATVTITDSDRSVISYSPSTVFRSEEDSPAPLRIIVVPPYFETFQFESYSTQFRDQNDLAVGNVDYRVFRDTLTAVNGTGPISHSVVLIDDEIMEPNEEFGIRLNVLGDVRVDVASSVNFSKVVIEDTDRISVGFRLPLYTFNEPETGNRVVDLIAETRGTTARSFSVNVEFTDDTAIGGGEDYNEDPPSTVSASFSAGTNVSTTINANILADDIDEFLERFNASLARGTTDPFRNRVDFFRKDTIIEIVDSDTVTFFVNTSVSTTSVPEDQDAMICIQRNGTTNRNYTVTIQPNLIPGGAQSSDFSTSPITFLFRPTDTQVCRSVPVVDDNIALEGNESFSVSITGTSPGVDGTPEETTTTTTEVITIIDNDDSMVFFETPRYTGQEGDTPRVCLNLTKPIARSATVSVSSSNTAPGLDPAESNDYGGVPSTVTFTNTSQQQCFDVSYNTDTIYERTEGATLTANPGSSGLLPGSPISTVLEIRDSNTPTIIGEGNMTGSGMNVVVRENETAIVCVSLSGSQTTSTDVPITFTLTPMQKPGATDPAEPEDYVSTPKTVTILPGQTRACTTIEVVEDTIDRENPEQFCVNITSDNPVIRYQPPECQIMITIIDNIRCVSYMADIVIVFDESRSINDTNYLILENFVLNITRQFPISETQTHIGLVRFSTRARSQVVIELTEFFDGDALRAKIDEELDEEEDLRGGKTYHNVSMMRAREELSARGRGGDVRQIIMLLTDGIPDPDTASAKNISQEIRSDGIAIYGVYIGTDQAGFDEITAVSTDGRAFRAENFNALAGILDNLIRDDCASVTVTFSTSNVEVQESAGHVEVCIEKSAESREDVNLTLTAKQRNTPPMLPGDARVGSDFAATSINVLFGRTVRSMCYNFSITDDDIGEPNEVFQVMLMILSPPEVATAPEPTANITIIDDDVNVIEFTTNDFCVKEDNRSVSVCVRKSRVTEFDFDLEITASQSSPPSARDGPYPLGDFVGGTRQLTFPKDSQEVCVLYEIHIEPTFLGAENNETFDVSFEATGPLGGNRFTATGQSMVTIKDEPPKTFVTPDPTTDGFVVPEGRGNVTVCIDRNITTSFNTIVTFIPILGLAQGNRATPGVDFSTRNKTVDFLANMTMVCTTIDITDDDLLEKNETFSVGILVPGHDPDTLFANVTIVDDDTADLGFGSARYYYTEDDGTGHVCVNTTKPLSIDVGIRLVTETNGTPVATARPGSDYTSVNQIKVLPAGQTGVCYDIPITKDSQNEPQEFFYGRFELTPSSLTEVTDCFGSRINIRSGDRATVFINDTSDSTCRNVVSDLVILIDESTSILTDDFLTEKQFAADLVGQFPVSQDGTHVSVIRFSNIQRTQVISHLGDVTDTATLRNIILAISNNDSTFGRGAFTHHKDAMILARQQINDRGRQGARKIVVLITDGVPKDQQTDTEGSNSSQSAVSEAAAARSEGVEIFCVGIFPTRGSLVADARTELNAVAGDPNRVSLVDNFDDLNSTLTNRVTGEICENECRDVVSDLAILIDESTSIGDENFDSEKRFAANLVGQFPVSQNGTHVSVIRFSNIQRTQVISHLGDVTDAATLQDIIIAISDDTAALNRGAFTHHKDAMILARQQFNDRGRQGARKIVVLITDGVPKDQQTETEGSNSPQSAVSEAAAARSEGVEIFCIGIILQSSKREEARNELNAIAGDSERVSFLTTFDDLNSTLTDNITGRICDNTTQPPPQCILREPLQVVPFHPARNSSASYNFRQMCEHIIAKPCNNDSYVIVGDFLAENLTMGRVGIQTSDGGYVIIDEDLSIRSSSPAPSSVASSFERSGSVVVKVTLSYNNGEAVIIRDSDMIMISIRTGNICGLCGDLNGNLYSSNGMRLDDVMNQTKVNSFASSWQRAPSEQILRDDRRECAVLKNDTVIGDPLFEAALWVGDTTCQYSLCYEIHGSSNQHYNLLSDLCVSVNAYYTPMRNPSDGNIISAIGIRASDDNNQCHLIDIVQDQTTGFCRTTVNSGSPLAVGGSGFEDDSVSVRQRMATRVRIGVPNCERIPLVMWVTCQNMSGELMMRFDISRGVNLRPSSHGLLGQFYNIRMQAQRFTDQSVISTLDPNYFDVNNLWVITATPPTGNTRNFVAELYERAWDNSRSPCLYAGNSQGGHSIEFAANYTDSVIEGHYTHYRVNDRFDTQFQYEQFDSSRCN